jgi:nicotinate-nucleotide adenylyltransferase
MDNIILLGGVFDPVHIGHLLIYKTIKKHLQFKKFIIIPSKNPPLKDHQPYAPIADRINMLKLLFGRYRDIEISTHEVFVKNKIVSYTIDTLKYFHKKYPNAHLYFVIGSDRYLDFKQ